MTHHIVFRTLFRSRILLALSLLVLLAACGGDEDGAGGGDLEVLKAVENCDLLTAADLPDYDRVEVQLAELSGFGDLSCAYNLGGGSSASVSVSTSLASEDRAFDESQLDSGSWVPGPDLADLSLFNPSTNQLYVWLVPDRARFVVVPAPAGGPEQARVLAEDIADAMVPDLLALLRG